MPRGARASKLETEKRIFTIQGWIISGVPDYLILKNIQQQFKDKNDIYLGLRQAKNLLEKAYKIWHENQVVDIEQERSLAIAGLQQDIRNMKDEFKGTPRGMAVVNQIKKEIAKLKALYPAKKLMIQGDKENPLEIKNSEEREARIAALIAKAQQTN